MRVFVIYMTSGTCVRLICHGPDFDVATYAGTLAHKLGTSVDKVVEVL